jgi:hypothetical protein
VTDAVLWELRGLTALTELHLQSCRNVTDVGLQHLSSLTTLTRLWLYSNLHNPGGAERAQGSPPRPHH